MASADDVSHQWLCVWRGIGLKNWLRLLGQRPDVDLSKAGRIATITLGSIRNSLLGAIERLRWQRQIQAAALHPEPIFILGHWRSGTTLLHNLMCLDPQLAFVNLYQAMFPGHFLLTEDRATRRTAGRLPATRLVDNMEVDWQGPHECETALLLMTLASPYASVAFPRQPEKYRRYENLKSGLSPRELERWEQAYLHFLRKVSLKHQPGRRFVLKSPPHTSRIPLLKKLFPQALFITITRNPYEVYASTLRLRQRMAELNGLSKTPPANLEEQVMDDYMKMYLAYHMQRQRIDPARLYEMRYEELVRDPLAALEDIYRKFSLPGFGALRTRVEAWLPEHHRYKTSTASLPPEIKERVYERLGPAFRRYGYPQ